MQTNRTNRRVHPIREVLRAQGRSVAWLARQIDRRDSYVRGVLGDHWPATSDFRARCARALQLPQDVLFHADSEVSGREGDPNTGSDSDRADTVAAASVPAA